MLLGIVMLILLIQQEDFYIIALLFCMIIIIGFLTVTIFMLTMFIEKQMKLLTL